MIIHRRVKECTCGYGLHEILNKQHYKIIETTCICPQCGCEAHHYLYVDKKNMQE